MLFSVIFLLKILKMLEESYIQIKTDLHVSSNNDKFGIGKTRRKRPKLTLQKTFICDTLR